MQSLHYTLLSQLPNKVQFLRARHFLGTEHIARWSENPCPRGASIQLGGETIKFMKYMAYQIGLKLSRKIKQRKEDGGLGGCNLTVCFFNTI